MNSDIRKKLLNGAKRIVVKVGTKLLVNAQGHLDQVRMTQLVEELRWLVESGYETILVSSGAIVTGLEALGLSKRPKELPKLQAAAAIGQGLLMHLYQETFSKHGVQIAQVLLTAQDLEERRRHLNAKNTFEALLAKKVVPIVNENDTVAVDEIKFGDNDQLSALVANLVHADLLIILTDQEGFLKNGDVVRTIFEINEEIETWAHRANDWKGIGGMQSKLEAARMMMRSGESMMIANGFTKDILKMIFRGEEVGTFFISKNVKMSGKKRWIAHFVRPKGGLVLDEGAIEAVCQKRRSLLLPGILDIRGIFKKRDAVSLFDEKRYEVGRGEVAYSSEELKGMIEEKGKKNSKKAPSEVIHRDHLVIL
ncbi:MAG: glutamate 5-kinase [Chlamydiae bacterium]|nr:glutamate 5-kinase [Chlamydiota bacterium]MBI3276435.1 glutamate 5-kinase [Chlamydiota bacterium]